MSRRAHVVVVGGGFGGLQATLRLARLPVEVTLIDRRNYHLFQPLAYQVATGALSPAEIAYPLRRIVRRYPNVTVLLADVTDIDLDARQVRLTPVVGERAPDALSYDTLIVSGGSSYNYFGHPWEADAPSLKTLGGALTIRRRILGAFEAAELEPDPARRVAWLTFVVVGGGPTGVEMAGQIAEIARDEATSFRSLERRRCADPARRSRRPGPGRVSARHCRPRRCTRSNGSACASSSTTSWSMSIRARSRSSGAAVGAGGLAPAP